MALIKTVMAAISRVQVMMLTWMVIKILSTVIQMTELLILEFMCLVRQLAVREQSFVKATDYLRLVLVLLFVKRHQATSVTISLEQLGRIETQESIRNHGSLFETLRLILLSLIGLAVG